MRKSSAIGFGRKSPFIKALTLALAMALADLPVAARERQGATVVVSLIDGGRVKGELLAVKDDVLVVFDHGAGLGWSLDLRQVGEVKVLRKSRFFDGAGIGLCVGLALSIRNLSRICSDDRITITNFALPLPVMFYLGGLLGALDGISERIPLNGEFLEKNQLNLEHLKRHARERGFDRPGELQ